MSTILEPNGADEREIRLPADVRSVRRAREAVAEMARDAGWTSEQAEPLLLVVSELATNAATHARSEVVLRCTIRGRHGPARIEVTDDDAEALPVVQDDAPGRIGGLGLRIVERLSDAWGFDVLGDRKVVWALIEP